MAYSNLTTITDWKGLLGAVYTFATSNGWTGSYDQSARTTGDLSQIGVYSAPCHVAIGEFPSAANPQSRTDAVNGGTVDDAILGMALGTSLTVSNTKFWNHPGSIVTTELDTDGISMNDVNGSFNNVWLFSGGTGDPKYVWAVVQSGSNRYTHFGFGIVDKLGMSHPDVGFVLGNYSTWWPNYADYSNEPLYGPNNPAGHSTGTAIHKMGAAFWRSANSTRPVAHVNIQSSTLPTGFPAAGVYGSDYITPTMYPRSREDDDRTGTYTGGILNYLSPIGNMPTTGGTHMSGCPVMFRKDSTTAGIEHCFLGALPGVRIVDCGDTAAGSTVTFGTEEWVVFPWVQKGEWNNMNYGTVPTEYPNTGDYGIAYKKNV